MESWAQVSSRLKNVLLAGGLVLAAVLVAAPPSLTLASMHSDIAPVAIGVLVVTTVAFPLLIAAFAWGGHSTSTWRRVATWLCVGGLALIGAAVAVDAFIDPPEGSRCGEYDPATFETIRCTVGDLPWTPLVALALTGLVGAIPVGLAMGLASMDRQRDDQNARLAATALLLLPFLLLAFWFLAVITGWAYEPDYGEERVVDTVVVVTVVSLGFGAWPQALVLAMARGVRPRLGARHSFGKLLGALAVGAAMGLAWFVALEAHPYEGDSTQEALHAAGRSWAGLVAPFIGAASLLPAGYALASALTAARRRRWHQEGTTMLAEVRSWYANGRLRRADFEQMTDAYDALVESPEDASETLAAFGVVGSLMAVVGLFGSMALSILGDLGGVASGTGFTLAFLLVGFAFVLGLRASSRVAARVDGKVAHLQDTHERLVHAAGDSATPAPPKRAARASLRDQPLSGTPQWPRP